MFPAGLHKNSGSDEGHEPLMDERKQKRMLSNRESARRSRMRKQKHLGDLITQIAQLKSENSLIARSLDSTNDHYAKLDLENTILRTQLLELTERLQSLSSVLSIVEDVSGLAVDIPEIPDPLMQPWNLPCPSFPFMAMPDMMHC